MRKTIDLHGCLTSQAKAYLLKTLDSCPSSVSELVVIHGSVSYTHLRLAQGLNRL